jgi:hypothetical protein
MATSLREAQLKAASDGTFRDLAVLTFNSFHQIQTQLAMIDDMPMDAPIAEKLPPHICVPLSGDVPRMAQRMRRLQIHVGQ